MSMKFLTWPLVTAGVWGTALSKQNIHQQSNLGCICDCHSILSSREEPTPLDLPQIFSIDASFQIDTSSSIPKLMGIYCSSDLESLKKT